MKKTVAVAFVSAVIVLTFATAVTRRLDRNRAAVVIASAENAQLRSRVLEVQSVVRTTRATLASLEQESATLGLRPRGGHSDAQVPDDRRSSAAAAPPGNSWVVIANDPVKTTEYLKNLRAATELEYGRIFKLLGFSPEQIDKFKDAEVQLEQSRLDIHAAIHEQGIDPNSPTARKLWEDYGALRVQKKAQVLGNLTARYLDLYRSQNVRVDVDVLSWFGMYSREALTPAQILRAGDILAENCKRTSSDGYPGWTDRNSLNWAAASEQLKEVLLPTQIRALGLMEERYRLSVKANNRRNALTAEFKKAHPSMK